MVGRSAGGIARRVLARRVRRVIRGIAIGSVFVRVRVCSAVAAFAAAVGRSALRRSIHSVTSAAAACAAPTAPAATGARAAPARAPGLGARGAADTAAARSVCFCARVHCRDGKTAIGAWARG